VRSGTLATCVLAATPLLPACRTEQTLVEPDPHLNRMLVQEKRLPYDVDPNMPHGMTMQTPPPGTLPTTAVVGDLARTTGVAGDRWVERIPISINRAAIDRGRSHFDALCAACHGVLGDGVSVVAEKMALRKPRNLLEPEVRAFPAGRLFETVRSGYGLMPSYSVWLSYDETWELVAYVKALELARGAVVADLPPGVRARLLGAAR
jgi:mono/diheme cytochrome c family protein